MGEIRYLEISDITDYKLVHNEIQYTEVFAVAGAKAGEILVSQNYRMCYVGIRVFDGPQIRRLLKDDVFVTKMTSTEKRAWLSCKNVVEQFLGNVISPGEKKEVSRIVDSCQKLKCSMSLKLQFMDCHVEYTSRENLGDHSEGQGERFHEDIKVME